MPELPGDKAHLHPAKRPGVAMRLRGDSPEIPATPAKGGYAELQVASNFSFLRGASHPDELAEQAAKMGCVAVAITDVNTLAGVVRAHVAAKESGIQFIVGCRLEFKGPHAPPEPAAPRPHPKPKTAAAKKAPEPPYFSLLVYPTDRASYGRLCRLLTRGKRRAPKGECHLYIDDLADLHEGLQAIVLPPEDLEPLLIRSETPLHLGEGAERSEAGEGPNQAGTYLGSLAVIKDLFQNDRLSLATSCLYGHDDGARLDQIAELSRRTGIPLVATNDVHYHIPRRRPVQDVLTAIRHLTTVQEAGYKLFPHGERYIKGPEEMARLFVSHPQALARTLEIARRCAGFSLDQLRYEYPKEVCPPGRTPMAYLRELTWEGAMKRFAQRKGKDDAGQPEEECATPLIRSPEQLPQGESESVHSVPSCLRAFVPSDVIARIEHEFEIIESLDYAKYFLTVHDIVRYARSQGILCQGRGAAANSAVCYCLGVTAVDPTRVDMLFERFVSKERNEPPDIDIDFEHERREEVIQYIYQKYGRERAALCAEVISYRGRSVIRDVGKAMGLSLDLVDQMARQLDWWDSGVVNEDRLREMGLDPHDATIRTMLAVAREMLGFPRHLSQHVGGFVITQNLLEETCPIENAAMQDRTVIEWDKDDIEAMGMLKVDCLGLGMLTAIAKAFGLVNEQRQKEWLAAGEPGEPPEKIDLFNIPSEDPAVYEMIGHADTVGIFQVESRAQMSMLPRLKPVCYYDLVIEVAIVRPGPIQGDMVHPYLRRRMGIEPIQYPNDAIKGVLARTLGVPLFQEQAMQLAVVAGGFTPGEADQLRRAIAAWKRSGNKITEFGIKLKAGMIKNGYTEQFAEQVFTQIQGFSGYGFPESHAASFALLVYISSWLKRYHPAAFTAALLNSQPMGFYAPAQLVRDAKEHGVEPREVDVNHSGWDCRLEPGSDLASPPIQNPKSEIQSLHPKFVPPHLYGVGGPALRLGMRLVNGLAEDHARAIEAAVAKHGVFRSIVSLWRASNIPVAALRTLARADAFRSMGLDRRQALWEIRDLRDEALPLFDSSDTSSLGLSVSPSLPEMPLHRHVVQDYATVGLSLKAHPVSFFREQLKRKKVTLSRDLMDPALSPHGKRVVVAGVVLCRQRPGTASGIVFITIEDETGIANLIVRPQIYQKYRRAARHAVGILARGHVERQGEVIHVVVREIEPIETGTPGEELAVDSRDFH
jgi:error-prone DNA polymerase